MVCFIIKPLAQHGYDSGMDTIRIYIYIYIYIYMDTIRIVIGQGEGYKTRQLMCEEKNLIGLTASY